MSVVRQHAEAMLPLVTDELARAKVARNELRAELVAAEAEVDRLRALELSLQATVNGTDAPATSGGLVGWRVGEAARAVLREAGTPLHYRDVWHWMRERGHRIDSPEPEAVVLTALTRHPDVERTGRGMYALKDGATVPA